MSLSLSDIYVSYAHASATRPAVNHLSLTFDATASTAIVGESGSGKSTIANAIMGLLPASATLAGTITLDDLELSALTPKQWSHVRGTTIGYIPQDPMLSLNGVLTIGYHFKEMIRTHNLAGRSQWRKLAAASLQEVGLDEPERILRQYPHQLSGGMRQRVLIALALLPHPKIVVADEPTSALDVVVQAQILDLLEDLTAKLGSSLILITHDLGLVADRCAQVAVIHNGVIVEEGRTDTIIAHPQHPYTQRLLAAVPKLSAAQGRTIPDFSSKPAVLHTAHLRKDFRLKRGSVLRATDDVSLEVRRGECVALVGESGSGKSTLAKLLVGLEKPTSGTITVHGRQRENLNRAELTEQAKHLQVVFQDPYASLDPHFTVDRTLAEPLSVHRKDWSREQRRKRIHHVLTLVDLDAGLLERYPSQLSGGQRQRVAIARALMLEPDVLVLDEAVSALDVVVQAQILETLEQLRRHLDVSMLFITHDLAVVAEITDTVAVIKKGQIVESGPVPSVFANPQDEYTKLLLDSVPGHRYF